MGDFNFAAINWETLECTQESSQMFFDVLNDNYPTQMVNSPTRGEHFLDLVILVW